MRKRVIDYASAGLALGALGCLVPVPPPWLAVLVVAACTLAGVVVAAVVNAVVDHRGPAEVVVPHVGRVARARLVGPTHKR